MTYADRLADRRPGDQWNEQQMDSFHTRGEFSESCSQDLFTRLSRCLPQS